MDGEIGLLVVLWAGLIAFVAVAWSKKSDAERREFKEWYRAEFRWRWKLVAGLIVLSAVVTLCGT